MVAHEKPRGFGHCAHCRFFGEHGAADQTSDVTERRCMEPELEPFDLIVTESAGCNHFEKAEGLSTEVEEPMPAPPDLSFGEHHTVH